MSEPLPKVYLVRHGETEWSATGRHTGKTDIPLTEQGEANAIRLRPRLEGIRPALVLCSPLQRARRTCELAGFGDRAETEPDLIEWDYGDYEGRTTEEIRAERPSWFLFRDGVPNGETVAQVGARALDVIDRALRSDGDVALFAHGHILRILTACWLELPSEDGKLFRLDTAGIGVLGFEHETRVILRWNV